FPWCFLSRRMKSSKQNILLHWTFGSLRTPTRTCEPVTRDRFVSSSARKCDSDKKAPR
ncbi:hypothetical protein AVEN_222660-1, partial [Araneus ventricosus]